MKSVSAMLLAGNASRSEDLARRARWRMCLLLAASILRYASVTVPTMKGGVGQGGRGSVGGVGGGAVGRGGSVTGRGGGTAGVVGLAAAFCSTGRSKGCCGRSLGPC